MPTPYDTLGVKADATEAQIKSASLKLAKKHHPDLNPGDKKAEERFKSISAAHDLLADPEKRARFDRGEIDAAGDPKQERPTYRSYADAGFAGGRYGGGAGSDTAEFGDIFADLFTQARRGPHRGRDLQYGLAVDVRVPPGMEDGQTLRLRGQGEEGTNGGPAGDALITVQVFPHPFFRREGNDIHLDLPVTLKEAVLGGRVSVPTVSGTVAMTIPRRSDTGAVLRLRGRGVPAHGSRPAGDQLVTLKVVLPDVDDTLEKLLQDWKPAREIDPRRSMAEDA
jgi:DnaJ-class molecular chaperone